MIIAISIVAVLVTIIVAITAIICTHLFANYKYGNTNQLETLQAQFDAWSSEKRANPTEIHERLVALENRAGVMIGTRR